jgi:hypothetical protein
MEEGKCPRAHHEVGHALAASLCDVQVNEICIAEEGGYCDIGPPPNAQVDAFIRYAGPWAEARYAWGKQQTAGEAFDRASPRFVALLNDSFAHNISDWCKYESQIDGGDPQKVAGASFPGLFGPDESTAVTRADEWEDEFEPRWAEIEKLAALLLVPQEVVTVGKQSARMNLSGPQSWLWQREGWTPHEEDESRFDCRL